MNHLFGIILLGLSISNINAVLSNELNETELIVRLTPAGRAKATNRVGSSEFQIIRPLVPDLGIYLVKVPQGMDSRMASGQLSRMSDVVYAQPDHVVTLRSTVPRDPEFTRQWGLKNTSLEGADIHAADAWDIGVGGKSSKGSDIVVAIVDRGMDMEHEDLKPNLWTNPLEIPGNKIDDDGNGYVDDVNGWNAFSKNGNVVAERHGTHVAGITGAAGNNGKMVSGVNWNVKIMPVMAATGQTSVVLEGYGYVLKQKKLWIESEGKKGANQVVTNSSFGVDRANCNTGEFVAWNDIYNEMGKVGILSAVATANISLDVDKIGDVPTGCTSPYLIKVTNTDKTDKKNSSAAFGKVSIDLGAPGTAIYSTLPGNKAGELTGTSMATPHVAGAVAFLHSTASAALNDLIEKKPGEGALAIKNIMLTNTDPNASLNGITTTGGRLNLAKAAKAASVFAR